jgi:exodeoxyribonuclease VII large subunit
MAVPPRLELLADLAQLGARLTGALARTQQERRIRLAAAGARLPDVASLAEGARQRLDDRTHRLTLALPNLLAARRNALTRAERGLPDPRALVASARQGLADRGLRLHLALPRMVATAAARLAAVRTLPEAPALLAGRSGALTMAGTALDVALRHATQRRLGDAARILSRFTPAPIQARLREATARLQGAAAHLEGVNPRAVLGRGYALVFDAAGHPVGTAALAGKQAKLRIEFADGAVAVRVERQGSLRL